LSERCLTHKSGVEKNVNRRRGAFGEASPAGEGGRNGHNEKMSFVGESCLSLVIHWRQRSRKRETSRYSRGLPRTQRDRESSIWSLPLLFSSLASLSPQVFKLLVIQADQIPLFRRSTYLAPLSHPPPQLETFRFPPFFTRSCSLATSNRCTVEH